MPANHNLNKPGDGFLGTRWENGRPFECHPDDFYMKGMAFCAECEQNKKTPTIAGLCRYVGISMRTYYNYCKRDEFAFEVEQVQMRIVEVWEGRLIGSGTAGAQFWLRNNAGYKDTRQTELSGPNGEAIQSVTKVEIVGVDPIAQGLDPDAL